MTISVREAFQQSQEAQAQEVAAKAAYAGYMTRYDAWLKNYQQQVSEHFKQILGIEITATANDPDKYTNALTALELASSKEGDKYINALEILGIEITPAANDSGTTANASDKYSDALAVLNLRQPADKDKYHALEILSEKANQRQTFLIKAKAALTQYQQILNDNKSIYIPTAKIPKEELKRYLEVDKNFNSKWLDDYYERAKATEESNWTWLKEQFSYRTTVFSTTEADEDWSEIAELVNDKLKQVSAELAVEMDGKPVTYSGSDKLPEDNLYALQRPYQTVKKIKALEKLEALEKEENAAMTKWKKDRLPLKQRLAKATFCVKLAEANHKQAILADKLATLEPKYTEIVDKVAQDLNVVVNATIHGNQAIDNFKQAKHDLETIDFERAFTNSTSYKELSCAELEQNVVWQFKALEKLWQQEIELLASKISKISKIATMPDNLQQLKQAAQNDFSALNEQKLKIEATKSQVKKFTTVLQRLTWIQLEILSLKKQLESLPSEDKNARLKSFALIDEQLAKVQLRLNQLEENEASSLQNSVVKTKFAEVKSVVAECKQVKLSCIRATVEPLVTQYEQLFDKCQHLATENITRLAPRFELGRAIHQLNEYAKLWLEKANIAVVESEEVDQSLTDILTNIKDLQQRLQEFKHQWNQDAEENVNFLSQLTLEVEAEYDSLILSYAKLPPRDPKSRFYENEERLEFYRNIMKFEQSILLEKFKKKQSEEVVSQINNVKKAQVLQLIFDEIKEGYQSLVERYNQYTLPQYKFHTKDRKQLYEDIVAFENSELFKLFSKTSASPVNSALEASIHQWQEQIHKWQQQLNGDKLVDKPLNVTSSLFKPVSLDEKNIFQEARNNLGETYIGTANEPGYFDSYLVQRHQAFWFRDFIGSIAASVLSCFGWKSEQAQREEYINHLKQSYQAYQEDATQYDKLISLVNQGLQQFKPRVNADTVGYDKTLNAYLKAFKGELKTIQAQNNFDEPVKLEVPL
ncbi:hypothetical protein ACNVED_02335 [Legionella sp. D16C41]|uniref:hypothetical protein n=1 Tax=Legionella sp. D16C41 TaxID=3402688 RepID=UPI003AF99F11